MPLKDVRSIFLRYSVKRQDDGGNLLQTGFGASDGDAIKLMHMGLQRK
jgi:hypothetical protein